MALPGGIPTVMTGRGKVDPMSIISNPVEMAEYKRILDGVSQPVKIKKVRVKIFDLSDENQVEEYEKLWAELLEKVAAMEVSVESHKDLVHRADGTSYWMKYVEYVEYGAPEKGDRRGKTSKNGERND